MAQLSSQLIALPRRNVPTSPRVYSPRIAAWAPVVIVLVGIISLFYLTQTSEMATTGYGIQDLQTQENNWKLRNEQVALDVARAKSLAAVEAQATGRLLMVPAKELVYLKVASVGRVSPSARGDDRNSRPAEKSVSSPADSSPLTPVQLSLSSLLAPGVQQSGRQ